MNYNPAPWRRVEMHEKDGWKPSPPLLTPTPVKKFLAPKPRPRATWLIVSFMGLLFVGALLWLAIGGKP